MRRTAALVVLAITGSLLAAGVGAAATPQQQINQLKTKITKLQNQMRSVLAEQACYDTLWAISQYGDPNGAFGYVWGFTDGSVEATTALDLADSDSGTAGRDFDWFVSYNPQCAAAALRHQRFGKHLAGERPVAAKVAPRIVRQSRWHW
jgi:hypothetical protein